MFTRKFWIRTIERMIRAFFVVLSPTLGLPQLGEAIGLDVRHVGWLDALSMAAGGMVASLVLSIIGSGIGNPDSPSILPKSTDT